MIQDTINNTYLLDARKNEMTVVEKFVYDIIIFHLNRLRKTASNKPYYAEFWWKRKHVSNDDDVIHNYHFDKDEQTVGDMVNPMLSTVTYLTTSHSPTIITNITERNEEDYAFPRKAKHICFDGKLKHGSSRVFDKQVLPPTEERTLLMINIWEGHAPINVPLFGSQEPTNELVYTKDIPAVLLRDTATVKHITLQKDVMNKIGLYLKYNKHKVLSSNFQNTIDINDILYDFVNISTV